EIPTAAHNTGQQDIANLYKSINKHNSEIDSSLHNLLFYDNHKEDMGVYFSEAKAYIYDDIKGNDIHENIRNTSEHIHVSIYGRLKKRHVGTTHAPNEM
ncbi:hypothetical protein PFDG_05281, partial [Plasmodium falciparum Dd2]